MFYKNEIVFSVGPIKREGYFLLTFFSKAVYEAKVSAFIYDFRTL